MDKSSFKTLRVVDGKEYVEVEEVLTMFNSLEKLNKSIDNFGEAVKSLEDVVKGMVL